MTDTVVATDQRWASKKGGPAWRVVSIAEDGTIALTGPGPCRQMKYLSVDDLERDYQVVS